MIACYQIGSLILQGAIPSRVQLTAHHCRAFFVASAIIAIIILVKEYADIAVEAVQRFPKILCVLYLFGAYVFAYIVR